MPNLMQRGASWLGERLKSAAGRTVTLTQGDDELEDLTGWISKHEYEVDGPEGILTKVLSYDWQFVVADLGGLELREGLEIKDIETGEFYESMKIDKRPAVENLDTSGLLVTVHCKLVEHA